ncbi:uncharacterized protein C8orf48 homolog [Ornithorhynchus anatinus]|uniref:Uncharacterized protein n=1 Tax=Ornithorhynchus anatinus TaxID=9258 RepID=A0A6I8PR44_ORNAN|nr:uncharacterized protein C8orf48 homolog [Ornithorhynchus anatinus]
MESEVEGHPVGRPTSDCSAEMAGPISEVQESRTKSSSGPSSPESSLEAWQATSNVSLSIPEMGELHTGSKLSDSAWLKKKLSRKWIGFLRREEGCPPHHQPRSWTPAEIPEFSEELDALQSFCSLKISQIQCQEPHSRGPKNPAISFDSRKAVTEQLNHDIPDQLVRRLHLKNILETVQQVAAVQLHQPSQCPDCNNQRAQMGQMTFLRRKKTLLESVLLREKMEEQLYTKDVITRLGEVHQSLPRLGAGPRWVWTELSAKAQAQRPRILTGLKPRGLSVEDPAASSSGPPTPPHPKRM